MKKTKVEHPGKHFVTEQEISGITPREFVLKSTVYTDATGQEMVGFCRAYISVEDYKLNGYSIPIQHGTIVIVK